MLSFYYGRGTGCFGGRRAGVLPVVRRDSSHRCESESDTILTHDNVGDACWPVRWRVVSDRRWHPSIGKITRRGFGSLAQAS